MLHFSFPALSCEPIHLEIADFIPADDLEYGLSALYFRFGKGVLIVSDCNPSSVTSVRLIKDYDNLYGQYEEAASNNDEAYMSFLDDLIERNTTKGTCTRETAHALAEYYFAAM